MTYCQVVSYLLAMHATDDVIADVEAEINKFKQPERMSTVRYSKVIWENTQRCGRVYD